MKVKSESQVLAIENESNAKNYISQTPLQLRFSCDLDYKASVLAISLGADENNVRHQSCRDIYSFLENAVAAYSFF